MKIEMFIQSQPGLYFAVVSKCRDVKSIAQEFPKLKPGLCAKCNSCRDCELLGDGRLTFPLIHSPHELRSEL